MVREVCCPFQGPTEREGNGALDGLTEELPQDECLRRRLPEFLGLPGKHVVRKVVRVELPCLKKQGVLALDHSLKRNLQTSLQVRLEPRQLPKLLLSPRHEFPSAERPAVQR